MNDLAERLVTPALRLEPPGSLDPAAATLTRADPFPTAVPKPIPLTRGEEALVQGFTLYVQGLMESAGAFKVVPVDMLTARAVLRALDVAGADRDRLGDQMVHEHRLRRAAERERDAAEGARNQAVRHLTDLRRVVGGRGGE
jgi:hypothetical protein